MHTEQPAERRTREALQKPAQLREAKNNYAEEMDSSIHFKTVSTNPATRGPVYALNDTTLELRCSGAESQRGLFTFATVGVLGVFAWGWTQIAIELIMQNIQPLPDFSFFTLLVTAFVLTTGIGVFYLYVRYGFKLTRLEMLTSRHLLIRFNRKTQQVHLHRPSYCGGIVTFAWRSTGSGATCPKDDPAGTGKCLGLAWHPRYTGLPHMEIAFVGKQGQGGSELRDEWEFIRRFMEEGPEGLPRPRLSTRFPSPIQAFSAQFEGIGRFFRKSSWLFKVAMLMVWPAFVVLGTCHWVSLMLCWRPRWPKIIREAGQPGKPIPPLTTLSDYPPEIQKRLLANADRWALKPGKRPEKKPRKPRIKKAPELDTGR
ncbi:hypothetical protein [Pseudomonas sp. SWRI51]|uniref:DUF6708 domain-containing protein n=1 Tax=Pseudomonas sp. SWRI51 TaxID=2745491 RepID=UPI0016794557|nr:hypothetical protein [Pseudomonas sp. SWRI51]